MDFNVAISPKRTENIHPYKNLYTNVHRTSFMTSKSENNPNIHQLKNGQIKCSISIQLNIILHKKEWRNDNATAWMNLEKIMQSQRSQAPRTTYCVIPFIWNVQNRQILRDRKQMGGCLRMERKGRGSDCSWLRGFFLGWWKHSGIRLVVVTHHCEWTEDHWVVHFKTVNKVVSFMLGEFYLN